MRRFGQWPEKGIAYVRRPGAYGVLYRDGQLLITRQALTNVELQLPGGGIDAGESPMQGLRREVLEETGYSIGAPHRIGAYQRFVFMPEYGIYAQKICHIFLARPARQIMEISEPGHSNIWMTPEEAAGELSSNGDKLFVQQFFGL